jgi:cytochrome c nitrite reductase small subunit
MPRGLTILTVPTVLLATALGISAGVGGYAFVYAQGWSYLTNDPAACANCHVMRDHYDAWRKSSHHAVAVCNDCHTPSNPVRKYLVKGENGFHHSLAFTTGEYPSNIRARPASRDVVEGQCRHCHADIVQAMAGPHASGREISCVKCHDSEGHLR